MTSDQLKHDFSSNLMKGKMREIESTDEWEFSFYCSSKTIERYGFKNRLSDFRHSLMSIFQLQLQDATIPEGPNKLNVFVYNERTGLKLCKKLVRKNQLSRENTIRFDFIFSDFLDEGYQKKLQILAKKHDVNGFRIYDNKELNIPQLGSVYMNPLESNKPIYLNTLSSSLKQQYRAELLQQINYFETSFKRASADFVSCELNEDHFNKLHELFRSKTN